ncbi:cytochrome P450 [Trametes polyzona]|nr:cytochrome P450 [Trametes polyzona]
MDLLVTLLLCTFVAGALYYWRWGARASRASPLGTIAGLKKEHWLTGKLVSLILTSCAGDRWHRIGNMHRLFKDGLDYNLDLFRRFGGVIKVHGMLGVEQLLVYDPLALQHVFVKDQDAFEETDMFIQANKLLFGEGLISTLGEQHRKQRKMLNPVFSLANLRSVLPEIQPIADEMVQRLQAALPADEAGEVNILPWLARGTIEYVGRGILGVHFDCLEPSQASAYTDTMRAVQGTARKVLLLRPFVPWIVRNLPLYWRSKLVDWLPFDALRELRDMADVMHRSAYEIFSAKKAEVEHDLANEGSASNLMSIMLRANISSQEKSRLTDEELVGQINTFLLGGQETTTSALARILHILASDPDAQARLRREVRQAKIATQDAVEGWRRVSLPYDVLVGLPYLDAVVRETLRLYPPTNMLNRVATRDTVLPLHSPIRSSTGELLSSVPVQKGTNVIVSILGSNRNQDVWGADAHEWRPERWLTPDAGAAAGAKGVDVEFGDESKLISGTGTGKVRYPGVYGGMMTFFGGNRACIGFKFAEMEIKQILSTLVTNMHFALPSAIDEHGMRKETYWRMDGLQVPVVREPRGDGKTAQMPLEIRLVREEDFA